MIKKLSVIMSTLVILTGCLPLTEACGVGISPNGNIYIRDNNYTDVTFDLYAVKYVNGSFSKLYYKSMTIPYQNETPEEQDRRHMIELRETCEPKIEDFSSFLAIAHFDNNTTYTIAGFTKEMDLEHNITVGRGADMYGVGYVRGDVFYSGNDMATTYTKNYVVIDINQTGGFTFSAGR